MVDPAPVSPLGSSPRTRHWVCCSTLWTLPALPAYVGFPEAQKVVPDRALACAGSLVSRQYYALYLCPALSPPGPIGPVLNIESKHFDLKSLGSASHPAEEIQAPTST